MSKRILIIDDEWSIQQALKTRLRAHGFEVHVASDGPSGIESAGTVHPDVILLDIRMPDMDGFEVFRLLRADPALAAIPVIFLTANVQDSARQEARSAGAAAFLSKPYDSRNVLDAILAATGATALPGADGAR